MNLLSKIPKTPIVQLGVGNITDFDPPAGPPPNWKKTYSVSLAHDVQLQGWSVLNLSKHPHNTFGDDTTYDQYPKVWPAIESLFEASKAFFAQDAAEKERFLTLDGSEEGYSSIKGEKEFITLRRNGPTQCPELLKGPAEAAWENVFKILDEGLRGVEQRLALPESSLTRFSEPCLMMDGEKRATMLRLFRYENHEAKVVAEPHMDLGLFSLVVGDTPGLEAWDSEFTVNGALQSPFWHPIEQRFEKGMATLMSGRQLQFLTHNRYMPGGHRVVSYGDSTPLVPSNLDDLYPSKPKRLLNRLSLSRPKPPVKEKYRYSVVFVLRAHESVLVDYTALEQPGHVFEEDQKECRTAGELFRKIKKAHFNINTGLKEREQQKQKLNRTEEKKPL